MIKSTKIIGVDSKGGRRSRTGSTVSMGITDREAIDCQDYFLDLADGEEPMGKVKKIELVIYYEDDIAEEIKKEEIVNSGSKLIEDIIVEQDEKQRPKFDDFLKEEGIEEVVEELATLEHSYNQGWISEEYYDKTKKELLRTKEHLPANQKYLELGYDVNIPNPCKLCIMNLDGKFCKLECRRNPESESDIDLFEVIPMSQRL